MPCARQPWHPWLLNIMFLIRILFTLSIISLYGCPQNSETRFGENATSPTGGKFNWNIRPRYPRPVQPDDNPISEDKFQLGRHLFYDERLSGNGSQSCASCHLQHMAFTDSLQKSFGSTGEIHPRNTQSLVNVSYNASYTWANHVLVTLEQQIAIPLFGEFPVEQGITTENQDQVLQRIKDESVYTQQFIDVFGDADEAINFNNIIKAIASFVRGINFFNSAFDEKLAGDSNALTEAEQRGENLFFGERLECFHCHVECKDCAESCAICIKACKKIIA